MQYPNQRQYATTKSLKSDKTNTNNKWMISELSLREILTSFEDVVIQQKQPRKMTVGRRQDNNYRYEIDIDELLNSMVDDLLLVFDSNDANDHQHQLNNRSSKNSNNKSNNKARRLSHGSQEELEISNVSQERLGLAGDADSNEEGRMDEECSLLQIQIAKPAWCIHLTCLLPQSWCQRRVGGSRFQTSTTRLYLSF